MNTNISKSPVHAYAPARVARAHSTQTSFSFAAHDISFTTIRMGGAWLYAAKPHSPPLESART